MKTTLSLLAVLALASCASDKVATDTVMDSSAEMEAPKAATVSLNISGMT